MAANGILIMPVPDMSGNATIGNGKEPQARYASPLATSAPDTSGDATIGKGQEPMALKFAIIDGAMGQMFEITDGGDIWCDANP